MKLPWVRISRSDLNRCTFLGEENPSLRLLRDNDLRDPAPFSHRALIVFGNDGAPDYIKPFNFEPYLTIDQWIETRQDVPVDRILGIFTDGHLKKFVSGMTFREVLFECLHGYGIIPETLDFLASNNDKDLEIP